MPTAKKNQLPKLQTLFPEELVTKFKMEALRRSVPVKKIYEEALVEFQKERKRMLKETGRIPAYLIPADTMPVPNAPAPTKKDPKTGKLVPGKNVLNAEVEPFRLEEVAEIAAADNRSQSTVLYTSLMNYVEKKKLWE
jgi:hypothetical protein